MHLLQESERKKFESMLQTPLETTVGSESV